MRERDETILFSAVAILLAVLTLGGLSGRALPDARAAAKERQIQIARVASCSSTAEAPSPGIKIDRHG
ncbi:MAG: hypothetical protein D4R74_03920 [Betaproteobacteria bacterium]|nr:MAG: hypothetical protein D4R74_03920 [Betaproteobacteria bacterium]